jgi:carboxyl-terminal processing protease
VASPAAREDEVTARRREIAEAAWRTVREKHYDPHLNGVDWDAMRRKYEPRALAAPDDATFYRTLNDMLGELGQSHMMITGPGASDDGGDDANESTGSNEDGKGRAAAALSDDIGDPGLLVRVIDGRPTVTTVRAGSSAAKHGVKPGFVVTAIGGRPLTAVAPSRRSLRPVEERFAVRRAALRRLEGPVGTKVTFAYLDNADRPGQVILDRDPPPGPLRQVGYLPPLHPEARAFEVNGVGVLAFNFFLLDPLLDDIKRAMDRFAAHHVKGVILDLRGNPGGLAAMAIPVASEFVTTPTSLGSMLMRDNTRTDTVATFSQTFVAQPALGRTPYTGPLIVLTDEGTASASEILAAGLQEAGRARVVGDASLGAVLPSVVESLPHGAVMQVVVADFKTPKAVLLEGRGVQPDRRVLETRAAFARGHDPVLDAALLELRAPPRPVRRPDASTDPNAKDKTPPRPRP